MINATVTQPRSSRAWIQTQARLSGCQVQRQHSLEPSVHLPFPEATGPGGALCCSQATLPSCNAHILAALAIHASSHIPPWPGIRPAAL